MRRMLAPTLLFLGLSGLLGVPAAGAAPAPVIPSGGGYFALTRIGTDGAGHAIVLHDLVTGAETTVVSDPLCRVSGGKVSPDGTLLAYDRGCSDGVETRVVPLAGGASRLLARGAGGPSWFPDGSKLLVGYRPTGALYGSLATVPAAGGPLTPVPGVTRGYFGAVSPDGRTIAFADCKAPGPTFPMCTVPWGSASATPTVVSPFCCSEQPAWMPDGRHLVAKFDGGGGHIELVDVASHTARTLSWSNFLGDPLPAPDGSVVYVADSHSGGVDALDLSGHNTLSSALGGQAVPTDLRAVPMPAAVPAGYVAITPIRVLDTRSGLGGHVGRLGALGTLDADVTSAVASDATAVALSVTAVNATATTELAVYPSETTGAPTLPTLSTPPLRAVANAVIVRMSPSGTVRVANAVGEVDVLLDVVGYFSPSATAGLIPMTPTRLLDTLGTIGGHPGALGAGQSIDVGVTGIHGGVTVPTSASVAVLNVTGVNSTVATELKAYPTGATVPTVALLHLRKQERRAVLVTAGIGTGGQVRLQNGAGSVHLHVDLVGYYQPGAGNRFVPVTPTRVFDTQTGFGQVRTRPNPEHYPLSPGSVSYVRATGTFVSTNGGYLQVPVDAAAVAGNLTLLTPRTDTYLELWSAGAPRPLASSVSAHHGEVDNAVVVAPVDGGLQLYNASGIPDAVLVLTGYFVAP